MFKKSVKEAWSVVKRGNMFMLAIGLLLGQSFNAVVSSLAKLIFSFIPGIDKIGEGTLFLEFVSALVSFLVVATFIFLMLIIVFLIKNAIISARLKKHPPVATIAAPSVEENILAELKEMNKRLAEHHQK
ncbi:large conductance mechanosensitive channel protein [Mycoplasmopsis maculosa]|uniref:Large conductance mechanosensitive channel protein n=1 Tax=Mycoplasmopsis maculosa TaxID=114885 RepID=A0A449B419_9BACT|nr:MscL family protein [Mycoplasmopsis maculosa]VEU75326.1 large conductance mechanosensitive channel protein [Mycoplasmopsis maculosa]